MLAWPSRSPGFVTEVGRATLGPSPVILIWGADGVTAAGAPRPPADVPGAAVSILARWATIATAVRTIRTRYPE